MNEPDLHLTAKLLNDVFKPKKLIDTEYLNWHYLENPAGNACIGHISEKTQQLSNYALIPKKFENFHGETISLGVGVDLAVHPKKQGKGFFRKTIENTYESGRSGDLQGILGIANSQSSPRMVESMGWKKLSNIPLRLLKLSTSSTEVQSFKVSPELIKSGLIEESYTPSLPINEVGYGPIWSNEILLWRLSRPSSNYTLHISESALLVTTELIIYGVRIAVLLKVFPSAPQTLPLNTDSYAATIAKYHKTPFVVYWGKNPLFHFNGLVIPRPLQPSPLDLVLHFFNNGAIASSKLEDAFELSTFEFFDFDAF